MEFGVHRVIGVERGSSGMGDAVALDHYIVLFVSSGGCRVKINQDIVEIGEYSLVLVARGVHIDADPSETRVFLIIYFSESFFARTDVDAAFLRNFKSFNKQEYTYRLLSVPKEYATYYDFVGTQLKLSKLNYNQAIYRDLAYNIVKQIVLLAAIHMEERQSGEMLGHGSDIALVRHFQELVRQQVKKEKQVAFYAAQLNIGSKKLTNLTKSALGVTPKEVIVGELLREAKKLLTEASYSIKQIAWELGYTDVNNFSTFFLKEIGMTPSEYRKRWQL